MKELAIGSLRIFFALSCLFLLACQQERNVDFFFSHPDELQSTYQQCLNKSHFDNPPLCQTVLISLKLFQKYLSELIDSPNQFSSNLMQAQIKLVSLTKMYSSALAQKAGKDNLTQLRNTIQQLNQDINRRFAVIRFVTLNAK